MFQIIQYAFILNYAFLKTLNASLVGSIHSVIRFQVICYGHILCTL